LIVGDRRLGRCGPYDWFKANAIAASFAAREGFAFVEDHFVRDTMPLVIDPVRTCVRCDVARSVFRKEVSHGVSCREALQLKQSAAKPSRARPLVFPANTGEHFRVLGSMLPAGVDVA
jgi:hypothetical protein